MTILQNIRAGSKKNKGQLATITYEVIKKYITLKMESLTRSFEFRL